jgi:hypothetical protein
VLFLSLKGLNPEYRPIPEIKIFGRLIQAFIGRNTQLAWNSHCVPSGLPVDPWHVWPVACTCSRSRRQVPTLCGERSGSGGRVPLPKRAEYSEPQSSASGFPLKACFLLSDRNRADLDWKSAVSPRATEQSRAGANGVAGGTVEYPALAMRSRVGVG